MQTAILLATATIFYVILRRLMRRGPLDRLPGPPSASFISGNMLQLFDKRGWEFHTKVMQDYGPVVKVHGLFNEPILYVFDPEALQQIFVRSPGSFEQAEESSTLFRVIVGPGMVSVPAEIHRKQRKIISPAFSYNHLRSMTPLFYAITQKLCDTITTRLSKGSDEVDMLTWLNRTALELIGQGGLGHSFDPLTEDAPDDEFTHNTKSVIAMIADLAILRQIIPFISRRTSPDFPRWILQFAPSAKIRELIRLSNCIRRRSEEMYETKKLALQQGDEAFLQQVGEGKDLLSLLIRANKIASEKDRLPDSEVIGQIAVLVIAGMDTIANATAQLLYRLSIRQDIQEKVRHEILEAGCTNLATFDDLMQLPWVNAVVRETLRLYATVPFVLRTAVKDTVLPLSKPVQGIDGSTITEIPVEKGTKVIIGVYGSNLNKDVWGDDAAEWKPERWMGELPAAVNTIPSVYAGLMTFVAGPRSCIGFKFAEVEMKILLSMLISRFSFSLTEKPVFWNQGHVVYPTLGPDSKEEQLPLKVSLVGNALQ